MNRTIYGIMLSLLFAGTVALVRNIEPLNAGAYSITAQPSPATSTDWWPMFHHDLNHSGYSTSTAPTRNQTLWSYETGGGVFSSPAVCGGVVYVDSLDHYVYALDAITGALVWRYLTGSLVVSSPAVSGGVVYVGSGDGYVYAINATNGALLWRHQTAQTGLAVDSSPAVCGGVIYIGSMDHYVYALDAITGALVWRHETGSDVDSSPAVSGGVVYVGSGDGYVYAINATNGALLWRCPIGFNVTSSPAVSRGVVYVGSAGPYANYNYYVYALNATNGAIVWRYQTGDIIESSPAVVGGVVYVGSDDDNVYALNATTGAYLWSYRTGDYVGSSPAVSGGIVYVGSDDYNVYALNATTGALVWSYRTSFYVESSPAVAGGIVYVGSDDGRVYAFGLAIGLVRDVAVTNVSPYKTIIGQGYSDSVNVTAANLDAYTETFNVTLYANTTAIATQTTTIASERSIAIVFAWNTTDFAKGNYTMWAYAAPVSGETNTANNTVKADVQVEVTIPGDVDGNHVVNIQDIVKIASIYGLKRGNPLFNPNCDLNNEGRITILDLVTCTALYGQK